MSQRTAICLLLFYAVVVSGADWPEWRGPSRNSFSDEKIKTQWPSEGLPEKWRAAVGTGFSSVAVNLGKVYTMGNSGEQDTIWSLEAETGRLVWKYSYPARLGPLYYEGGPGATPTVKDGQVFTISKWGNVLCLNASDGAVIWERDLHRDGCNTNRWGFAGSPLVWKDLVFLNVGTAGTALDRKTGRTVWQNGTNAAGYASPVLFKDSLLILGAKAIYALEPNTGHELWRFPFITGYDVNDTDPLILGDRIFISSYSKGCVLLSVEQGQPSVLYEKKNLHNHLSPGIPIDGYLYAFEGEAKINNDFRCLNIETGELRWTCKDPAFGSLICVNEKLLILSAKGELLLAKPSPAAFEPLARTQVLSGTCWTPPALANGLLYVRNARGDLVCLDLRP